MKLGEETVVLGHDITDPEQLASLALMLKEKMLNGETPREALGISDEEMESMYSVAYRKYQYGEYARAKEVFRFLIVLDGKSYRYILGMAASLHHLGELEQAVNHYLLASFHAPTNPIPYFHAAECLLKLGNRDMAQTGLAAAIKNAGSHPEYKELKERASLMLETLKQEAS